MIVGAERYFCDAWENRKDIIQWEVMDIRQNELLRIEFISVNSKYRQGIRIAIDVGKGKLKIGNIEGKNFQIWTDTMPKIIDVECMSESGKLSIYNIWDEGQGLQSLSYTSGMLINTVGNKQVFYCNDFGMDCSFDKLIFSIEKITDSC